LSPDDLFLTELDPRAKARGSVDPLGAQMVWTSLGRELIANLTGITRSVRSFTTLLVGLELSEAAARGQRDTAHSAAFLAWEQLAGYARWRLNADDRILGIRKVEREGGGNSVRIGANPNDQLLGNQRSNGILGLYKVPARVSGLVEQGHPPRLTPVAREFVRSVHFPGLEAAWGPDARRLVALIAKGGPVKTRDPGFEAVAGLHKPKLRRTERAFYRAHLAECPEGKTSGRQAELAQAIWAVGHDDVSTEWIERLKSAAPEPVAERLERIRAAQSLLSPASALYSYLQLRKGVTLADVAADVESQWGRLAIDETAAAIVSSVRSPQAREWARVHTSLLASDYAATLRDLIALNTAVMHKRGGAPWVSEGDDKLVVVRYAGSSDDLPAADQAQDWRYGYFLPSLNQICASVGPPA
jgi:hypothetical protein